MKLVDTNSIASLSREKLAVIDAVRGWAILLVILTHCRAIVPELPYPVLRFIVFGWYGVQLFFIASAFTLLLSWHRQRVTFAQKTATFFLRRFLRIAPMYYFAAVAYIYLTPPPDGFDLIQFVRTLSFVNAWAPDWMGVEQGTWQVVPGGWSISVEFSFYIIFPLLAVYVHSLARSFVFFAAALILLLGSWYVGQLLWADSFSEIAMGNFLYFWFPNQLAVFATGFLLFFFVVSRDPRLAPAREYLADHGVLVVVICFLGYVVLVLTGIHKTFSSEPLWFPTHILISILFAVAVAAMLLARRPLRFLTNDYIRKLGVVSFSGYLVQWTVIQILEAAMKKWGYEVTGVPAVLAFFALFAVCVLATYAVARVTYETVELPFMKLAKKLSSSIQARYTLPENSP